MNKTIAQKILDTYWIDGECGFCRFPGKGHHDDCPIDALSFALARIEELERTLARIRDNHKADDISMAEAAAIKELRSAAVIPTGPNRQASS